MVGYELVSMDRFEAIFNLSAFALDATEFEIPLLLRVLKRQV